MSSQTKLLCLSQGAGSYMGKCYRKAMAQAAGAFVYRPICSSGGAASCKGLAIVGTEDHQTYILKAFSLEIYFSQGSAVVLRRESNS